jgi:hypothetical protein
MIRHNLRQLEAGRNLLHHSGGPAGTRAAVLHVAQAVQQSVDARDARPV